MDLVLDVSVGDNASDLREFLESPEHLQTIAKGVDFKVTQPVVPPGTLASIDPDMLKIIIACVGGSGAITVGLNGFFKVLQEYAKTRQQRVKITVNKNTVEISGNIPSDERERIINTVMSCVKDA